MHADNVYDIVAQDYQLPDMTGLEIARKVLKTTPGWPVIMFTGHGNESIATEALRLDVSSYIHKDFRFTYMELFTCVVLHLDQRGPTQAR